MIEEFDGSFLIRAFLIERECEYSAQKCFFTGPNPHQNLTDSKNNYLLTFVNKSNVLKNESGLRFTILTPLIRACQFLVGVKPVKMHGRFPNIDFSNK